MIFGIQRYGTVVELASQFEQEFKRQVAAGRRPYFIPHPELGWITAADTKHTQLPYSTDGYGYRRTSNRIPSGPNIAFYGDSFVHGDEVPNEQTWLWQLQQQLHSSWTVHNAGVSGYGTDQAFLRFKQDVQGKKLSAAVLSITTTGLYRNLNVCRSFIAHRGDFPFLKPRYVIQKSGAFLVLPPTMDFDNVCRIMKLRTTKQQLRRFDRYYPSARRYFFALAEQAGFCPPEDDRLRPEAIAVAKAILTEFHAECAQHTTVGCVLLLPVYWGRYRVGSEFDTLAKHAAELGLSVIDARDGFAGRLGNPPEVLHHPKNHYTETSGGWIADLVAEKLPSMGPHFKGR
jgi:hypothetical protein